MAASYPIYRSTPESGEIKTAGKTVKGYSMKKFLIVAVIVGIAAFPAFAGWG